MSFFINYNNPNKPGPMNSNGLGNICEKVLIETKKVFDACVFQTTESNLSLTLGNHTPANPTPPLTYISAESTPNQNPIVSDATIERIDTRPNFANVSYTVEIPITVTYRDANGVLGTATSSITLNRCVILFVPQTAVTPIDIKVDALFSSSIGTFSPADSITNAVVTGCFQIITKVVAKVDILVPSYGYPVMPPCQSCDNNNSACPGFFELPLYPTAQRSNC